MLAGTKGESCDMVSATSSAEGDAIKVYVRVRPLANEDQGDHGLCLSVRSSNTIHLHSKPEPKIFTFDHVADVDTTQESVFSSVAKNIVESCMSGYNGTIFAYGQTGSGKTFTMMGPPDSDNFNHNLRGVIPRIFEYLFFLIEREKEKAGAGKNFLCKCSFIEIYNEQIFDLLDSASAGLPLREHVTKGVFVFGAVEQVLTSAAEAYQVLKTGWRNRRVASTSMNRESSRSHAVFTITVESMEKSSEVVNIRCSQLNLVDLAGSERQKDTHAEGVRLKEAGNINRSLSCLGQVITALVDVGNGKQRHICYRDSRLTFLLRDSLGGNAKTCIIANVHPGSRFFGETLSTLNFAQRAKLVKNKAVINEDTQGSVKQLQSEVKKLKEQLALLTSGKSVHDISLASDKELSAVKMEYDTFKDKQISELSISHMNLQLQLDSVRLEHEKILEGKTSLQDDYDNLQEVLKFETDQLTQQLIESKRETETLKAELRNLTGLLESEKEHNQKLIMQLQEEDKEHNSKEHPKALEILQLEKQSSETVSRCEQQEAKLQKLEQNVIAAEEVIASQQKTNAADQEVVADLMNQIQEMRLSNSQMMERIEGLTKELEDINCKYNSALASKEESKVMIEDQERQIEELREALERALTADRIEKEFLCEDLHHTSEQLSKLTEASKNNAVLLQYAQDDLTRKTLIEEKKQLDIKTEELENRRSEYEFKMRQFDCSLEFAAEALSQSPKTPPNFNTDLAKFLDTQEQETADLRAYAITLEHIVSELNDEREVKNIEILRLRAKETEEILKLRSELEKARNDLTIKEAAYWEMTHEVEQKRALELKAFQEKEEMRSKLEEMSEEKIKIEKEMSLLRKQVEFLAEENGKLVGHQNLNQKIQYLVKLKKDNAKLTEENEVLRVENAFLKRK
ncbi:hypothetical protein lerEdw1_008621 [Lerista edwardsae]|nr:hypothetical protein lerEdw1_008621 [Lerista edwardsae]